MQISSKLWPCINNKEQTHTHTCTDSILYKIHNNDSVLTEGQNSPFMLDLWMTIARCCLQLNYNKYVGPHCRAEIYAGRVACCSLVSMRTRQTDRRTDGRGQPNKYSTTSEDCSARKKRGRHTFFASKFSEIFARFVILRLVTAALYQLQVFLQLVLLSFKLLYLTPVKHLICHLFYISLYNTRSLNMCNNTM